MTDMLIVTSSSDTFNSNRQAASPPKSIAQTGFGSGNDFTATERASGKSGPALSGIARNCFRCVAILERA
ncbi:MAG TPA: hypothetical protein VEF34_20025 [Syntrophobacteraceae bacterium]|nr:hypothetical protein [Syntrophobacteraceae bacterium]